MTHTVEAAKSGRSKCRGCGKVIVKDDLRFGEQMENPFASDASMTLWFHVKCGALRRPASFSEVLRDELLTEMAAELEPFVTSGVAHHRLDRIAGVERAPSGRAKCRHCQETIAKDEWRIPLTFFEEGMFNSSGFVHLACGADYFGTQVLLARLQHFSPDLAPEEITALAEVVS